MREYEERRLETWRELAEASEPPRYGEMRDEMMSILLPYGARDESTTRIACRDVRVRSGVDRSQW